MTSTTTRFRSRPVEIEAMRFQKPYAAVALWCDGIILTDGGSQVGGHGRE